MTQDEALKLAEEYGIDGIGNTMYEAWEKDHTLTRDALVNKFSTKVSDKVKAAESGVRQPITEAFGVGADKIGAVLNPRSDLYWGHMKSGDLLKIAKSAGYVDDLPGDASEEEKQANRAKFGNFLNYLSKASTDYERRNIIRDYENTQFLKDPVGWSQNMINTVLFNPTEQRMKEQALKGEGPSRAGLAGFADMGSRDIATLGTDIASNAAFGAGGSLAGRVLAGRALKNYLQHYGSVAGAGVLGGLGKAAAKDIGTDEGARWYEYPAEAAIGAGANALGSEITLKLLANKLSKAAHGVKSAKKVANKVKNASNNSEMRASEYLDDLLENAYMDESISNGYIRPEDAQRIVKDMQLLDEGLSMAPYVPEGEAGRYVEDLDAMYRMASEDESLNFYRMLDQAISTSKNNVANGVNPQYEAGKQAYLEATRRLFQNGVIPDWEYMEKVGSYLDALNSAKGKVANFNEMLDDARVLKNLEQDFVSAQRDDALRAAAADEAYEDILRSNGYRLTPSTAEEGPIIYSDKNRLGEWNALKNLAEGSNNSLLYGRVGPNLSEGMESQVARDLLEQHPVVKDYIATLPDTKLGASLRSGGKGAKDILDAAIANKAIQSKDQPDNSPAYIEKKFNELSERKPEAVKRVMGWLTDTDLPAEQQLTPEDRQTIDAWRVIQMRRNLLGGD